MNDRAARNYSEYRNPADIIAQNLQIAGKDLKRLTATDLGTVDEFHIRGRKATLELAEQMKLGANSHVLDIGSGLGGPARTVAETYGCRVTGIDLTKAFCDAKPSISYVATPKQMGSLLTSAGFSVLDVEESTDESQRFFEKLTANMERTGVSPVAWRLFLGNDFPAMARNQVRNVNERRIRTVTFICAA